MEPVRRTLRGLGYVDGQNLAIEYRHAEGKPERLPDLAAALVRAMPDVLLALGGDVTPAVVSATQTIPIVFSSSADPVQLGFVASLARPGRNATGVTFLLDELASKPLDILKQIAPRVSRVGFLSNPDHLDNEWHQATRAAGALAVELTPLEARRAADFDAAFQTAMSARVDALYVVPSRLTAQPRSLPSFYRAIRVLHDRTHSGAAAATQTSPRSPRPWRLACFFHCKNEGLRWNRRNYTV
jgi:putative tryptophan/tyrosine transport system substrate-binding protein